jgi:hypothetical protein
VLYQLAIYNKSPLPYTIGDDIVKFPSNVPRLHRALAPNVHEARTTVDRDVGSSSSHAGHVHPDGVVRNAHGSYNPAKYPNAQ